MTVKGRIRWTAGEDGVAHAHRGMRAFRALCGVTAIAERYGRLVKSKCSACLAAVAGEPTEGENRALWGDR